MARFLFIVPPLTGHINPTISVAAELRRRGHDVAWSGYAGTVQPLLPENARLFALPEADPDKVAETITAKSMNLRGPARIQFLFEGVILPMARHSLPGVRQHVEQYQPDLLIVDQQALAGVVAARQKKLPWVTFATTTAAIIRVFDVVDRWIVNAFREFQEEVGLDVIERPDISPYGSVVFSSELLVEGFKLFDGLYRFVGPCIRQRPDPTPFPFDSPAHDQPVIFITLGTVNRDRNLHFYEIMMAAFADRPVQVVMVTPEKFSLTAPNFICRSRVPQLKILPKVNLVISHAGHNTVCETLFHGIPLMVIPITDDQPVIAQQVTQSGAGKSLRFSRLTPEIVHRSAMEVLEKDSFRISAKKIRASFRKAKGERASADFIEKILGNGS